MSTSNTYLRIYDFLICLLCSSLAHWIRFDTPYLNLEYIFPATTFSFLTVLSFNTTRLYLTRSPARFTEYTIPVISGILVSGLLTASLLYLTKTGENFSRLWLAMIMCFSAVSITTTRSIISKWLRLALGSQNIILVYGDTEKASQKIHKKLHGKEAKHNEFKLAKSYFIKNSEPDIQNTLTKVAQYTLACENEKKSSDVITEIWITSDVFFKTSSTQIELTLSQTSASLIFLPEMPSLISHESSLENTLGILRINSGNTKAIKLNLALKFLEDKVIAALCLILFAPILLIIALLIKTDSKGPIFFKQTRQGFAGQKFEIYKFRTMQHQSSGKEFIQATKDDPRITHIGKFLRRSSLDELPQLVNVLNGTMSIVGPRPHPIKLNSKFRNDIANYMARHSVKPGITGLAQINGFRGETDEKWKMESRVRYDIEYVKNWSVALDLKILLLTLVHLVSSKNAY